MIEVVQQQYKRSYCYQGLSTDVKPTLGADQNGVVFMETDTGQNYVWYVNGWYAGEENIYKTVYEYAVEGGYVGTETEFQETLAGIGTAEALITGLEQQVMDLAINVKLFDAKGDGVSSDKNAFQNAITYASTNNCELYIPNGEYDLDSLSMTVANSLKIRGQSKDRVILKKMGQITTKSHLSIKDLTLFNISGEIAFRISPSTGDFVKVLVNNVNAYNDYAITNKTKAHAFVYYYDTDSTKSRGISYVDIQNCQISRYASYALSLRGYTMGGIIHNNTIRDLGFDTNNGVRAITGGFQGSTGTTGSFENVTISNNFIENLYSKYGENENGECQAIICYGGNIRVLNNTIKNMYGGGREEANLESGYDHEAIYLKAGNSVISGNTIINGAGDYSNSAICCKGHNNLTIDNNRIQGLYGGGIMVISASNLSVLNNEITLYNESQTAGRDNSCVDVELIPGNAKTITIRGNRLITNKRGPLGKSCCIIAAVSGVLSIEDNYLEAASNKVLQVGYLGVQDSGAKTVATITGNKIVSDVGNVTCDIATTYGQSIIRVADNVFTINADKSVIRCIAANRANPAGKYIIENNTFVNSIRVPSYVLVYEPYSLTVRGNKFEAKITETIDTNDYVVYVIQRAAGSGESYSITDNLVTGGRTQNFVSFGMGGFNLGSVLVKDNLVDLYGGRLVSSSSSILNTTYLGIFNNVVSSSRADCIVLPSQIATGKLFESGNMIKVLS